MTDRDPRSKRYGYKSGFRRFWKPLSKIKNGSEKLGEELYVFEDFDTSEDEIDTEPCQVFELHNREDGARKVQQKSHNLQFVERPVMPGDTLRALALRYNVPVAVIKQVNNLLSEQDFYALNIIKIPVVTPQSYRLELLEEEVKQRNASRRVELPSTSTGIYESLPLESEIHLVSIGGALKSPDKNKEFFKRMDADLERIRLANNSRKSSLEQVTYSLTSKTFHPFNKEEKKPNLLDGFRPWRFLAAFVFVMIMFPIVFYIISVLQHKEQS